MSNEYIEDGYIEDGYFESVGLNVSVDGTEMVFFISNGSKDEATLLSTIKSSIGDNEVAVIYIPEAKKIVLSDKSNHFEFNGGNAVADISPDSAYYNQIIHDLTVSVTNALKEQLAISMTACVKASDGSIISNASVTKVDDTTFNIVVPDEVVGTGYQLTIGENCGGDGAVI